MHTLRIFYIKGISVGITDEGRMVSMDVENFEPLLTERLPHHTIEYDTECDLVHGLIKIFPDSKLAKYVEENGI